MSSRHASPRSRIFVYGTLRRATGHPMSKLLDDAQWLGRGWVAGRLYDLGSYPGLVATRRAWQRVRGEVYFLPATTSSLRRLDRYEGCGRPYADANEYVRRQTAVHMDDGTQLYAWAYWYNGPVQARQWIAAGDYVAYRASTGSTGRA